MIDLHLHGAFGVNVQGADAESLDILARGLAAHGVEGFLPTLVPAPLDALAAQSARISAWIRSRRVGDGRGAMPLGIHFEGPFVSRGRCGALRPGSFRDAASPGGLDAFLEAVGEVPGRVMVTVAPEIPGGIGVVSELARRGWIVSLGHTDADAATLDEALAAGARHMTHFGNAMRPLHHREPGAVGWGLVNDAVTVDVIADGHHLSASFLKLVLRAKGPSRVAVISDAVPPAGLPDGDYSVWGETLRLSGGCVRNTAGALAGSAGFLDGAVAHLSAVWGSRQAARASARDVPLRILEGARP